MAVVHFYEKPGCVNNARQKQLLRNAGHVLVVHDLLHQPWAQQQAKLRSFFGAMPVAEWFNRSAPAVKNGTIDPHTVGERQAIDLMVAEPLLIRRPLLESEGRRCAGFDPESIAAWFGVFTETPADLEKCPQQPY